MDNGYRQIRAIGDRSAVRVEPMLGDGDFALIRACVRNAEAVGIEAALPAGGHLIQPADGYLTCAADSNCPHGGVKLIVLRRLCLLQGVMTGLEPLEEYNALFRSRSSACFRFINRRAVVRGTLECELRSA